MSLERIVRQLVGDFRFERRWPCTVVAALADNEVEIEPDDEAIRGRGLSRVPVRSGIAGAGSRAEPGARCLLAFDDGDPRKPVVVAWEWAKGSGTVKLDGGSASVARNGDLVEVMVSKLAPINAMVDGVVTLPNGVTLPTSVPGVGGTTFTGTITVPGKIYGRILGGARRVKA